MQGLIRQVLEQWQIGYIPLLGDMNFLTPNPPKEGWLFLEHQLLVTIRLAPTLER
jgi:hypothetical protein